MGLFKEDIYIIGDGGFAKEIYWLINEMEQYNIAGFVGNTTNSISIKNHIFSVMTDDDFMKIINDKKVNVVIGVGMPKIRKYIADLYNHPNVFFPNIISPKCIFDEDYNVIGFGNILTHNTIFTANIKIGNFNVFNLGSTIGHDVVIGDLNVFNPTTCISGNVNIGNYNLFGVNSTVLENKKIGNSNILGALSLLNKNIENDNIMVGIPAKKLEK